MKVLATWFRRGRGLALGVLIASLTLGKAVPYLVNAVGTGRWRTDVLWISILAAAGGLVVLLFVGDGPYATPVAPFDPRQMGRVFANRGVRLAAFGYFGHMWELYAMWTWAPIMIRESFEKTGAPAALAELRRVPRDRRRGDRVHRRGSRGGSRGAHAGDVLGDGSLGRLLPRGGFPLRRESGASPRGRDRVGRIGRRRLGAVLRRGHGAVRPALHRHRAHRADVCWLPPDQRLDRVSCRISRAPLAGASPSRPSLRGPSSA